LHSNRVGGILHDVQCGFGAGNIRRINEYGNPNSLGHHVVQKSQPLGHYLGDKKIDTCRVAAGNGLMHAAIKVATDQSARTVFVVMDQTTRTVTS
jgi:hypothetical protein